MAELTYLDYEGLQRYHELIVAKIDSGDAHNVKYVAQTLTSEEKAQARANIGAGTVSSTSHTITVKSGKKADGSTDISATSTSATNPSVTLGDSGVTAGEYGPTANQTPAYGATFNVPDIKVNAKGIVTSVVNRTVKIPASDNTNTTYKFTIGDTTLGDTTNGVNLGSLESKSASASGKDLSLVTTGEKATWNGKQNALTNPVTRSGSTALTADKIVLGAGTTQVKPSSYGITTTAPSSTSDDTTLPTSKAVWSAISSGIAANDAMVYSGTIEGGSTEGYGALTPAASKGNTYKVTKAGKNNGIIVIVGIESDV